MRLRDYIDQQLAKGKYAFSLQELKKEFNKASPASLKRSLARASEKGHVVSVYQGYYIIVPPAYRNRGILPPKLFIDGLMKHLGRSYYVGLLSAATWYGAAHQQPQEFYVVIHPPALRPTEKKGIRINYINKENFPPCDFLQIKNTDTGTIKISSPLLTALDCVRYVHWIGGMDRVARILSELGETMDPREMTPELLQLTPISVIQRTGYLLEQVTEQNKLAEKLFQILVQSEITLYRTPLKMGHEHKGYPMDDRWKVVENGTIELE